MLKVFIVDDELLVRTSLKTMIDWESNGFCICGEASTGIEALKAAANCMPDIFLSDIRMPEMDGLELSYEINREFGYAKLIMLSNYDDFDYVRGTLKNGAIDYILKHKLNSVILLDTLSRAKELITKESVQKYSSDSLDTKATNNVLALKEKFIIQLITGFYKSEDEIRQHLKMLDIKLDINNVLPVIMSIDDYHSTISKSSLRDTNLMEYAVVNISEEILSEQGNGAMCHIANEKFIILCSFANIHSYASIDNYINSTLGRIANCLKKYMNISVSYSIGSMCDSITGIFQSYEAAEKNFTNKFILGKSRVFTKSNIIESKNMLTGMDFETEKQLHAAIKLKDKNKLSHVLENTFNYIKNENLNHTSSQMILNDLLGLINRVCKEKSIELSSVYTDDIAPHELLAGFETLEDISKWIFALFDRLLAIIDTSTRDISSEYVKKAISYIHKHYSENISLASVADEIGITNVYLSSLFKEETKVGFSEYLCDLRIEKAKVLLEEGKQDIKAIIQMCGFNDYAYFFKVFRKKIGVTPKEFLRGKR